MEARPGTTVRRHRKRESAIRRHAGGEPALPDASERLSNGLRGVFRAVSIRAVYRSKIRGGDAAFHGSEQPLRRTASNSNEAFCKRLDRASELHMEPLHGYRLERRLSAIFCRRNSVASSRKSGAGLWTLRLRHPAKSERAIRLSIATEDGKSGACLCAERLAGFRNGVLAYRYSVFGFEHALFSKRTRHRERQRSAIRERGSRRATLRTQADSGHHPTGNRSVAQSQRFCLHGRPEHRGVPGRRQPGKLSVRKPRT